MLGSCPASPGAVLHIDVLLYTGLAATGQATAPYPNALLALLLLMHVLSMSTCLTT